MHTLASVFGVGLQPGQLSVSQVVLRGLLVFVATLVIVRVADKRFFAKKTAFDVILGFILASMMARAINGAEALVPTIVTGFVLALLHRGLGFLACRWPRFGDVLKGSSQTIVEEGREDLATMQRHHIAQDDLMEELRLKGVDQLQRVKLARLERSGEISVIRDEAS